MNVFHNLIGTLSKEDASIEPARMAILDEPSPGVLRHAEVGMDGVMLTSGRASGFVSFRELFKLVEGTDGRVDVLVKLPRQRAAAAPPARGDNQEGRS